MHRALEKMAKQLNAYDEDSLMSLWERYAMQTNDFEPTRRWEEGALVFCMLQAVRWKNQLFNYHVAATASPVQLDSLADITPYFPRAEKKAPPAGPAKTKATVLRFPGKKDGDT